MSKNYYITTAIAYTSGKPHIGNVYEIILADSIARFKRLQGYNVRFQTGTDEHGQKIEEYAKASGKTPKDFVDNVAKGIKSLFDCANISYDHFIRTTDEHHEKQVQKIFKKFYDQGDIYKGFYEGCYCTPCEAFWTNSQLKGGKCPDCGREVINAKEEAYFFKMSKYADRLIEYYNEHPDFILPVSRKNEMVNNFLKAGLQDLCVSRTTFKWGVPVDFDPKHVVYVWLDALVNYITGLGYDLDGNNQEIFETFWPADLHVVGKDIMRFHIIYWPIFLMALGLPLPKKVYGHGWLLQNGEKMSKSKGNVLYFDDLANVFGRDAVRYYALNEMGFENDGLIGWDLMTDVINSDLANVYGNLVSRTIAMTNKYFGGKVKYNNTASDFDSNLIEVVSGAYERVVNKMDALKVSDALKEIFAIFRRANKYIDETAPWILAKDESQKQRLETVMYNLCEAIIIGTSLLQPFMPETCEKVFKMFNINAVDFNSVGVFNKSATFSVCEKADNLFPRLVKEDVLKVAEEIKQKQLKEYLKNNKVEEKTAKELIDLEAFDKLEIKVGEVLASERVEKSDKLLKNTIQIGNETRTIVSGIAKHYSPQDMVGKKVLVVTNLKPIKLRGIESSGMVLCAVDENNNLLKVTTVDGDIPSGSEVC